MSGRITSFLVALILVLPFIYGETAPIDNFLNPLVQFHLDESAGTRAENTGSVIPFYNGTATNAGIWTGNGKYNNGINSSTGYDLTWRTNLSSVVEYTISVWFKPSVEINDAYGTVSNLVCGTNAAYSDCSGSDCVYLKSNGGDGRIYVYTNSDTMYTTVATWKAHTWYHLAYTSNASHGCLWINGTVDICSASAKIDGRDLSYMISAYTNGASNIDGALDEIYMFDYALTASEMTDLYNGTAAVQTTIPVLSDINHTSGWKTSNATNDTTPTLTFDTDLDAYCAISDDNFNYSDMGSAKNCTGGEGTTSHTCVVTAADTYAFSLNQVIYLSCVNGDALLNQSSVATSEYALNILPDMYAKLSYYVDSVLYDNTTFQEGEDFITYLNLTANGDDFSNATCNISFVDGINSISDGTHTICSTGCTSTNFKRYEINVNATGINDSIHFDLCRPAALGGSLRINISCPDSKYTDVISASSIKACSAGSTGFNIPFISCLGEENINVTFTAAVPYPQRFNLSGFEFDREYALDVDNAPYATGFYSSGLEHEYYKTGNKTVYVNCTFAQSIYDKNASFQITIGNSPPDITHAAIMYDAITVPFTSGVTVYLAPESNITFFQTITDNDLANRTIIIYNESGEIINATTVGSAADIYYTFPASIFLNNGTYNFTTIARDLIFNTTTLMTPFTVNKQANIAPNVVINTSDNFPFNSVMHITYTPLDYQNMSSCSLVSNFSTLWVTDAYSYNLTPNTHYYFNATAPVDGAFSYYVSCTDSFGLLGNSANYTAINLGEANPYNSNLLAGKWFNTEALNLSNTSGVILLAVVILLYIAFIIFAEYTKVAAIMLFVGVCGIFFAFLISALLSVVIGWMIGFLSVCYCIRSVAVAKEDV